MRARLMRWHRRAGIAAGLLVLLAAVTGVLINHADALGLPQRLLRTEWLLRWYGIDAPRLQAAQPLQGRWLSQWGPVVYLDGAPLRLPAVQRLVGAVALAPGLWLLADREQALLLDAQGVLVEALTYPAGFTARRLGAVGAPAAAVIEGEDGSRLLADADGAALRPADAGFAPAAVQWAETAPLPAALHSRIETASAGVGVSAERVLLDLHSGRWLGRGGVWLMDAAAVALLFLAGTGGWTLWRRWRTRP